MMYVLISVLCCRWKYKTESELEGSSHWGLLTTYSGAGYVQDLRASMNESQKIIDDLFNSLWITRGTRAVFIDFTVYNANINLFCVVRYVYSCMLYVRYFPLSIMIMMM